MSSPAVSTFDGTEFESPVERAMADLERVRALQGRIKQMERTRLDSPAITTLPGLADVLPGGALRQGATYSIADSLSLVMALLAGPSGAGAWCGVVGIPDFGIEAAAYSGIDLARLVLVPRPGAKWLSITAALADAVSVVVTRPLEGVRAADAARLASRLRQRGTTLIAFGEWPRADARLSVTGSSWSGVGRGHGYPSSREVTVTVWDRTEIPRTIRMLLPDASGGIRPAAIGRPAAERLDDVRFATERYADVLDADVLDADVLDAGARHADVLYAKAQYAEAQYAEVGSAASRLEPMLEPRLEPMLDLPQLEAVG
jgi:hypothetical protein